MKTQRGLRGGDGRCRRGVWIEVVDGGSDKCNKKKKKSKKKLNGRKKFYVYSFWKSLKQKGS